jgi:predicted metal-binding protein
MKAKHTIFVCTTCASQYEDSKRVGESGGFMLLNRLQEYNLTCVRVNNPAANPTEEFAVASVECMGVCNRPCAILFSAPNKYIYLFGDVSPESSPEEIAGIFDCASKYHAHPKGLLPWAERSQPLKDGIIVKIPPVSVGVSEQIV